MKFDRIRDLREDNDYKQIQLADYLCVTQSTYSNYETGIINIPIEAFIKLSIYYNTSVDYLLGLTNNPSPYERNKQGESAND